MNIVDPVDGKIVGTIDKIGARWVVTTDVAEIKEMPVMKRWRATPPGSGSVDNVEEVGPTAPDYLAWYGDALAVLGYLLE